MSGLFGIISSKDCRQPLFYGTDYHSHLGTKKAGLAVLNHRITRCIHDISTSQFKSKFIEELPKLSSVGGIASNRVTRVLLVTAFANIGSTIGTVIALPYIAALLF